MIRMITEFIKFIIALSSIIGSVIFFFWVMFKIRDSVCPELKDDDNEESKFSKERG